jgi:hypothetical protein
MASLGNVAVGTVILGKTCFRLLILFQITYRRKNQYSDNDEIWAIGLASEKGGPPEMRRIKHARIKVMAKSHLVYPFSIVERSELPMFMDWDKTPAFDYAMKGTVFPYKPNRLIEKI